jgi:hypothetical protein
LAQFAKWYGVPDGKGPIVVLILSLLGTVLFAFSNPIPFERLQTFAYFSGFINVALTAAGIFGFTRAGAAAITATSNPPAGAGANPTVKA